MTRSLATLAAISLLALAGCGGGSNSTKNAGSNTTGAKETATPTPTATATTESGGGGGGETLQLAAPSDGSLKFDKTTLDAKAGKVTIDFDNPSSTPHAVEIEGNGVEEASQTVTDSKTSVSADLKPGTYDFYCPVAGHRQAGMEGTLTVK